MISVIQLTEADNQVGFGHLRELHAIGSYFEKKGIPVDTYALGTRPSGQLWAKAHWVIDSKNLIRLLSHRRASISIWSFRRELDAPLRNLFVDVTNVRVWITDQPGEPFPVEVVIIPQITEHKIGNWPGRVLQGLEYLPIEPAYAENPLPTGNREHDVLMSLGGADPSLATLHLLPAIADFDSTVVIGPGFVHADEVRRRADELRIRWFKAPDGLHGLLRSHRTVVTAGGNTLAEAAASGTPALVAWEDPHEREQGEVFERLGAGIIVGQGALVEPSLLKHHVRSLLDSELRLTAMAAAGRKAVDGCGASRIVEAILKEVKCE